MKRILFVMMLGALVLAACGTSKQYSSGNRSLQVQPSYAPSSDVGMPEAAMPMPTAMPYGMGGGSGGEQTVANSGGAAQDRMVIQNADLAVVVKDPEQAMKDYSKMAADLGGFVVSSNLYQNYTSNGVPIPEANLVIRVPAGKLEEALGRVKNEAVEIQSENRTGQDITSQYVDLQSQLKNLEAAEQQLVEIMSKAEKTEDVMNVFNQLTSIRGQIEVIKGQMKYFEEAVALSAITIRFIAEETVKPLEVGGWQIKGWARDAVQNLLIFLQGFTKFLINLVISFLPQLLIVAFFLGLPLWLIVRAVRKAVMKKKTQDAAK